MTKFSAEYVGYLRSDAWAAKRRKAIKAADGRCQFPFCRSTVWLEVHHKTYERLGREYLSDLTVYCHFHHRLVTFITRAMRFLRKVVKWFLR